MKPTLYQDNTVIWRYMKLSTFMLLMEGKVFVPTVSTLQSMDPREGRLGESYYQQLSVFLRSQLEGASKKQKEWFLERVNAEPLMKLLNNKHNKNYAKEHPVMGGLAINISHAKAYASALAKMRAAWCWFMDENESAAMWEQYGKYGVAIRSTVGALEEALKAYSPRTDKMVYLTPQGRTMEGSKPSETHIIRPYTLKLNTYIHEKEVRYSFLCIEGYKGRALQGLALQFIKEIRISPAIPIAEAEVIINYAHAAMKITHLPFEIEHSNMAVEAFPELPSNHENAYKIYKDHMPKFFCNL